MPLFSCRRHFLTQAKLWGINSGQKNTALFNVLYNAFHGLANLRVSHGPPSSRHRAARHPKRRPSIPHGGKRRPLLFLRLPESSSNSHRTSSSNPRAPMGARRTEQGKAIKMNLKYPPHMAMVRTGSSPRRNLSLAAFSHVSDSVVRFFMSQVFIVLNLNDNVFISGLL